MDRSTSAQRLRIFPELEVLLRRLRHITESFATRGEIFRYVGEEDCLPPFQSLVNRGTLGGYIVLKALCGPRLALVT